MNETTKGKNFLEWVSNRRLFASLHSHIENDSKGSRSIPSKTFFSHNQFIPQSLKTRAFRVIFTLRKSEICKNLKGS